MTRIVLFIITVLVVANAGAENYFTQPLHSDENLSRISLPFQKEIDDLLKGNQEARNVVLNYFKTLEFTKGTVSREQERLYKKALSSLDEQGRAKLQKIEADFIETRSYKRTVVDVDAGDHHLPIRMIETGK